MDTLWESFEKTGQMPDKFDLKQMEEREPSINKVSEIFDDEHIKDA